MDERVYSVGVCGDCLTQIVGGRSKCDHCGNEARPVTIVRFRVARAAVLKQADPHKSLVERTVYFGAVERAGHYYWSRGRGGYPVSAGGRGDYDKLTPWGLKVDGGLPFPRGQTPNEQGEAHVFHLDGWTALAFPDRSVDSRGGSWSVYCIPAVIDGHEALAIAREAFPPIFARYTFDVMVAT